MGSSTGTKSLSRIRAGGVVTPKSRLARELIHDSSSSLVSNRKLRIAGLPNRKAANLKSKKR